MPGQQHSIPEISGPRSEIRKQIIQISWERLEGSLELLLSHTVVKMTKNVLADNIETQNQSVFFLVARIDLRDAVVARIPTKARILCGFIYGMDYTCPHASLPGTFTTAARTCSDFLWFQTLHKHNTHSNTLPSSP